MSELSILIGGGDSLTFHGGSGGTTGGGALCLSMFNNSDITIAGTKQA